MKPLYRHLPLFLGAALATSLYLFQKAPRAGGPGQQALDAVSQAWPPPPERIVNLDSCNDPAGVGAEGCKIPMSPGQGHTIYTVPLDRSLVVTDCELQTDDSGSDLNLQLLQETTSGTTVMRGQDFNGSTATGATRSLESTTGLVFAPGSSVILRRTASGAGTVAVNYSLTGYLR